MEKERTFLTLFHTSGYELGLAMSWRSITLKDIAEDGGLILIQVETDQASELFEQYEHLFCTSFASFEYRAQIIYIDALYNNIAEARNRIYTDLKKILVNSLCNRFQM
jgi:hypothetical protein